MNTARGKHDRQQAEIHVVVRHLVDDRGPAPPSIAARRSRCARPAARPPWRSRKATLSRGRRCGPATPGIASNDRRASRSSPAPWTCEWLASTCSISVVPERGRPKTKTGRRVSRPAPASRAKKSRSNAAEQTVDEPLVIGRRRSRGGCDWSRGSRALASRRHSAARAYSPRPSRAWASAKRSRPRGLGAACRRSAALRGRPGRRRAASTARASPAGRAAARRPAASRAPCGTTARPRPCRRAPPGARPGSGRPRRSRAEAGWRRRSAREPRQTAIRPASAQPSAEMGRGPIGIERDHPLPAGDRLGRLFHLVVQLGQPLPEVDVARARARRPSSARPGASVNWPSLLQHQAEMGVRQGQLRVQPQRFQVRDLGVDQPLEHPQRVAQVVVQHRRVRDRGGPPPGNAARPPRPCPGPAASGPGWSGPARTPDRARRRGGNARAPRPSGPGRAARFPGCCGPPRNPAAARGRARAARRPRRSCPAPASAAPRLHSASG